MAETGVFRDHNKKADTFSLSFQPFLASEKHAEPHLSELDNSPRNIKELADRTQKQRSSEDGDVNAPLCPLLPAVKRNKDNKLAMHLEGGFGDRRIVQ